MNTFGYTTVAFSHSEITIHSTDPAVLQTVQAEIVKVAPHCFILSVHNPQQHRMPNGDLCFDTISQLGGIEREVGWYILKLLTALGWEPFHVEGTGDWDNLFDSKERVHLRKESV